MKIWVGKRESDIQTYNYFDYSITFWGSNYKNNSAFCTKDRIHSNSSIEFIQFIIKKLRELTRLYSCELYFYNNTLAYKILDIDSTLNTYIKNINNVYTHNFLRHKTFSRLWLSNITLVPSFASVAKHQCSISNLKILFPQYDEFVIQENYSGGGEGTYLLNQDNFSSIISKLTEYKIYLASPYYQDSISVSCALLIDEKNCCVFPISEQLLNYKNNKICYCGNKFFSNDSFISITVKQHARVVGNQLRLIGYRGICGIDFIVSKDNKVFLIEINPRFQGSSFAINEALRQQSLPSLFELNTLCFCSIIPDSIKNSLQKLTIDFENRCVFYPDNNKLVGNLLKKFNDGYEYAESFEQGVYLYRYFSST